MKTILLSAKYVAENNPQPKRKPEEPEKTSTATARARGEGDTSPWQWPNLVFTPKQQKRVSPGITGA